MRRLLVTLLVCAAPAMPAQAQTVLNEFAIPAPYSPSEGIATDALGYVYVVVVGTASPTRWKILKYTAAGGLVRVIGDGVGFPTALAVAPDGNVYVGELLANGSRVSVWTPTGGFASAFSAGARDIAIDRQGTVYVAERDIGVYTADGRLVKTIDTGVEFPAGIAIRPDGTLWVTDYEHHQVVHAATDGSRLGQFGVEGSEAGQFVTPRGIAATETALVVSDASTGRLQQFGFDGTFVGTLSQGVTGLLAADCMGAVYGEEDRLGVLRWGAPGTATCGDPASDPAERLRVIASAARRQGFVKRFGIAIRAGCNHVCGVSVAGTVTIGHGRALRLEEQGGFRVETGTSRFVMSVGEPQVRRVIDAVRSGRKIVAKLRVTAADALGHRQGTTRTVRLSR